MKLTPNQLAGKLDHLIEGSYSNLTKRVMVTLNTNGLELNFGKYDIYTATYDFELELNEHFSSGEVGALDLRVLYYDSNDNVVDRDYLNFR